MHGSSQKIQAIHGPSGDESSRLRLDSFATLTDMIKWLDIIHLFFALILLFNKANVCQVMLIVFFSMLKTIWTDGLFLGELPTITFHRSH